MQPRFLHQKGSLRGVANPGCAYRATFGALAARRLRAQNPRGQPVVLHWSPLRGLPKWWLVTVASGIVATVCATTLESAGAIAAIVAAAIATVAFSAGAGRWLWDRLTGASFRRGLDTSPYKYAHFAVRQDSGVARADAVGFVVHATRNMAIAYKVEECTVHVGDGFTSPLLAPFEGDTFVAHSSNFIRDAITLPNPVPLPAEMRIEYRVVYRPLSARGRYRRFHQRAFYTGVAAGPPGPAGSQSSISVTYRFDATADADGYIHRWHPVSRVRGWRLLSGARKGVARGIIRLRRPPGMTEPEGQSRE